MSERRYSRVLRREPDGPLNPQKKEEQLMKKSPIAIVGIGCKLPGGIASPSDFWSFLMDGGDGIRPVPEERFSQHLVDKRPGTNGRTVADSSGFVDGIDQFDARFFGISPREAAAMDPQQRMLLEVSYDALENAGTPLERITGSSTGVFVGISTNDYVQLQYAAANRHLLNPYTNAGGALSIAANRISFCFNLRGPSMAVDTACSSSLVAFHLACQSIWNDESSMAIVGGVNALLQPEPFIGFSQATMISPEARCRTFQKDAKGFVRAEGAIALLLKPLDKAIEDRDAIYALVEATATNTDGYKADGLSVPSATTQAELLRRAYDIAGIAAADISYIEAHGTGTSVGDPIETNAIAAVAGYASGRSKPCPIGSVKTNIGHLEAGSGLAGLVKAALIARNRVIAPTLVTRELNPDIDFDKLGLRVVTEPEPLHATGSVVVGVNSFGVGGANAHAVLSSPPKNNGAPTTSSETKPYIFALSAKSPTALEQLCRRLLDSGTLNTSPIEDWIGTAAHRRSHFPARLAVVASSTAELEQQLNARLLRNKFEMSRPRSTAFVFTGQGPQWWGMGRGLLKSNCIARAVIERCHSAMLSRGGLHLLDELRRDQNESRMGDTAIAQPAIFAIQIAIAEVLKDAGVIPAAVIGHSVGEVAAAYVAGALDFDTAVEVILTRGRLQQTVNGGRIAAVGLTAEKAKQAISEYSGRLELAAINGQNSVSIAGDKECVEQLVATLSEQDVFAKSLRVEVAFHCFHMDPIERELKTALKGITSATPTIPLYSTVTGSVVGDHELGAEYWWQNVRAPVLFGQTLDRLKSERKPDLYVELGPHPALAPFISEVSGNSNSVCSTLSRESDDNVAMSNVVAALYEQGVDLNWNALAPKPQGAAIFPQYPWQRERYWNDSQEAAAQRRTAQFHPLLGAPIAAAAHTWRNELDGRNEGWLRDHAIQGTPLYPAAAFVEMAVAAAHSIHPQSAIAIEDFIIHRPLPLGEDIRASLRTSVSSDGIFSIEAKTDADWQRQVTGVVKSWPDGHWDAAKSFDEERLRSWDQVSPSALYQDVELLGYHYGSSFQGIRGLWRQDKQVIAKIELPQILQQHLDSFHLHPVLLDAAFQCSLAALPSRKAYLPASIHRAIVFDKPQAGPLWARLTVLRVSERSATFDLVMYDAAGVVVASIREFRAVAVSAENLADHVESLYYGSTWIPRPNYTSLSTAAIQAPAAVVSAEVRGVLAPDPYPFYSNVVPQLAASCIWHALATLRNGAPPVQALPAIQLAEQHHIAAHQQQYFELLLEILQQRNLAQLAEGRWTIAAYGPDAPEAICDRIKDHFPEAKLDLELYRQVSREMSNVLSGVLDPLQLLFGSDSLLPSFYRDSGIALPFNLKVAAALAELLRMAPSGRVVRILEIGAGTGGTTTHLLTECIRSSTPVYYCFTDVSPSFFAKYGPDSSQYPFVDYRLLDINKPAEEQGFQPGSFDIIVATNVLHATPDIRKTLTNTRALLAPGGHLLLNELNRSPGPSLLFGMTKGWWEPSDGMRSGGPLIEPSRWPQLLLDQGFSEVAALTEAPKGATELQVAFVAVAAPASAASTIADGASSESARPQSTTSKRRILVFGRAQDDCRSLRAALADHGAEAEFAIIEADAMLPELITESSWTDCVLCITGMESSWERLSASDWVMHGQWASNVVANLARAYNQPGNSVRLSLVTRNARNAPGTNVRPDGALATGLFRTLAVEHPGTRPRLIDLDQNASFDSAAIEILSDCDESDVVLRNGERFVERIIPLKSGMLQRTAPLKKPQSFRLETSGQGLLDRLALRAHPRRAPGPGEVEIQVVAAGLNFRDVLFAKGILKPENLESKSKAAGWAGSEGAGLDLIENQLGGECSGVVVRSGANVDHVAVGDRVFGIVGGSMGAYATVPAELVVRTPSNVDVTAAGGIAITFATVEYALTDLARLQPGELLLVHGAAGGTGLAAIQLALACGARVFGTAGTQAKRDMLRDLGVERVFNSRSLRFADEIHEETQGAGVDVVLNSLAGEGLLKSLETLADFGRFVEIGRRDIDAGSRLNLKIFERSISFIACELAHLTAMRPGKIRELLERVRTKFESNVYTPVPTKFFPLSEHQQAFRAMLREEHRGKIVLKVQPDDACEILPSVQSKHVFRSDGTYVVSGGTRGFGLGIAEWIANSGAGRVVVAGRNLQSPELEETQRRLQRTGIRLETHSVDVSQPEQVDQLISRLNDGACPVRGVFHAAMVLDDQLLVDATPQSFSNVFKPKIAGAWNLHQSTLNCPLDYFVMFSSLIAMAGNNLQAAYAAANAWLDGFCSARVSRGLPALSVGWGGIDDVGFVERNPLIKNSIRRRGFGLIRVSEAVAALGQILQRNIAHLAITGPLRISGPRGALLTVEGRMQQESSGNDLATLKQAPRAEQIANVTNRLAAELSVLTGTSAVEIAPTVSLQSLGLDSLMAVEFQHWIRRHFEIELSSMKILRSKDLESLALHIVDHWVTADLDKSSLHHASQIVADIASTARNSTNPAQLHHGQTMQRWTQRATSPSTAAVQARVLCFAPLGAPRSVFDGWMPLFPAGVELLSLSVRQAAKAAGMSKWTIQEFAEFVSKQLIHITDVPFIVYGHSMGAIVGAEVAAALERRGARARAVVVAAFGAPNQRYGSVANVSLEDAERDKMMYLEAARRIGIPDEISLAPGYRESVLPKLRLEQSMLRYYQPHPEFRLHAPVLAMYGTDDRVYSKQEIEAWRAFAAGSFEALEVQGSHLFLIDGAATIVDRLSDLLDIGAEPAAPLVAQRR